MANRTAIRIEDETVLETVPYGDAYMNASIRKRSQLVETGAACAIILSRIPIQLGSIFHDVRVETVNLPQSRV